MHINIMTVVKFHSYLGPTKTVEKSFYEAKRVIRAHINHFESAVAYFFKLFCYRKEIEILQMRHFVVLQVKGLQSYQVLKFKI